MRGTKKRIDSYRIHPIIKECPANSDGKRRINHALNDERAIYISLLASNELSDFDFLAKKKHGVSDTVKNYHKYGKEEKTDDTIQAESQGIQYGNNGSYALELVPVIDNGFRMLFFIDVQYLRTFKYYLAERFVLLDRDVFYRYGTRKRILGFIIDNLR